MLLLLVTAALRLHGGSLGAALLRPGRSGRAPARGPARLDGGARHERPCSRSSRWRITGIARARARSSFSAGSRPDRRDPARGPARPIRPGGRRDGARQRARRLRLHAARRPRPHRRDPAVGSVPRVGRRGRGTGGRQLRGARQPVRHHHVVPAAGTGQPLATAPATPAPRDARHVSPLADGRQSR